MGTAAHERCRRGTRPPVGSIGRPCVGLRKDRQTFWRTIAAKLTSEKAGVLAGVSPVVGARWFRQSSGMLNVNFAPLSSRFLSFAEREEIGLLRAQDHGIGEIARQSGRPPHLLLASCAATPPLAADMWSTEPRRHTGILSDAPDARRRRSSPASWR